MLDIDEETEETEIEENEGEEGEAPEAPEEPKRGPKPPEGDSDRCVYVNERERRCSRKARADLGEGNLCKQHHDKIMPSDPPPLPNTHAGEPSASSGPEAPKAPIGALVQDTKQLGTQIAKTVDMLIPFAGSVLLGPDFGQRLHAPPEGIETLGAAWGTYLDSMNVQLTPGQAVVVFTILIYGPIGLQAFKEMSAEDEEAPATEPPPQSVTDAGVKGAA